MTHSPAAIRAWLQSLPYSTQAKAALAYVEALERVAEAARRAILDERNEDGGTVWFQGGQSIQLGDALRALDALKAGKEGRG